MTNSGAMPVRRHRLRGAVMSIAASAVFVATLVFVLQNEPLSAPYGRYLLMSAVFACSIGIPAWIVMPRFAPRVWGLPAPWRWSALMVAILAITVGGCLVGCALIAWWQMIPTGSFWGFYWSCLRLALLLSLVSGIGSCLYESMRQRLETTTLELRTKELDRQRALNAATTARLASLESKIHPHFLFNALNSISSLIPDDPRRAERLVERMAALLRFSLDSRQIGLVPLDQEMKIVRDYLEIEKVRFAERLRFAIDQSDSARTSSVPPLSIQTLVENAVKHAVAPRPEGGEIRVTLRGSEGAIEVKVADDGPGFTPESIPAGHGLDNLNARLEALFGGGHEVEIQSGPGGWTIVGFRAPQPTPAATAKV